ncbi:hypothetical protein C8T65DRAFT_101620 [Cerioporus squamosus]|nr:hypothetical protein C8T65DRAFT_101620 [Cerioporus squamosus]
MSSPTSAGGQSASWTIRTDRCRQRQAASPSGLLVSRPVAQRLTRTMRGGAVPSSPSLSPSFTRVSNWDRDEDERLGLGRPRQKYCTRPGCKRTSRVREHDTQYDIAGNGTAQAAVREARRRRVLLGRGRNLGERSGGCTRVPYSHRAETSHHFQSVLGVVAGNLEEFVVLRSCCRTQDTQSTSWTIGGAVRSVLAMGPMSVPGARESNRLGSQPEPP